MQQVPELPIDQDGRVDPRCFALMRHAVWIFDPAAPRMLHANAAALALWRSPDLHEFLARDFSKASEAMRARTRAVLPPLERGEAVRERNTFYPRGEPVAVDCLLSGVRLPDGGLAILLEGFESEISPHELRALEALRHTSALVTLYDAGGRPLFRNPRAAATYPGADRDFGSCFVDADEAAARWLEMTSGHELDARSRAVVSVLTAAGPRWHVLDARLTRDPVDGATGVLVDERDVTAEIEARARVEHMATHDPLTDLANRTLLRRSLERALNDRDRQDRVALLCLDLDRFKVVNDTHGHAAGDALLCSVARCLRAVAGPSNAVAARLGGDEFAVLLTAPDAAAVAVAMAGRVVASVAEPFVYGGRRTRIGVSVGIAVAEGSDTADDVLRKADVALYEVKRNGREGYRMYEATLDEGAGPPACGRMPTVSDLPFERPIRAIERWAG